MPVQLSPVPFKLTAQDMGVVNLPQAIGAGQNLITNNLLQQGQRYQNQIGAANAQYQPYMDYANALQKTAQAQFTPFQLKSNMLSNPLFVAQLTSTPEGKQIFNNMLQGFSNFQNNVNSSGIPAPGQMGSAPTGGILDSIRNAFGGNNNSQFSGQVPSMQSISNGFSSQDQSDTGNNNYNNNPPSPSGVPTIATGAIKRATAPYYGLPQSGKGTGLGAGTTYYDPDSGQWKSAPTSSVATRNQIATQSMGRLEPILNRLPGEAAPFLSLKGDAEYIAQKAGGYVSPGLTNYLTNKGYNQDLVTKHAAYQSDLNTLPESLVKLWGINPTDYTLSAMKTVVEPEAGESPTQYKQRIVTKLNELKSEELASAQQALQGGIPVSGQGAGQVSGQDMSQVMPQQNQAAQPQGISQGSKILSKNLQIPSFSNQKEALAWFRSQPKITQDAIRLKLGGG